MKHFIAWVHQLLHGQVNCESISLQDFLKNRQLFHVKFIYGICETSSVFYHSQQIDGRRHIFIEITVANIQISVNKKGKPFSTYKTHDKLSINYRESASIFTWLSMMKFGLQKVIAGNSISLIGAKLVSTLIRVGFDLYRTKNVIINNKAKTKHNTGIKIQHALLVLVPRVSLKCCKPWIVVVDLLIPLKEI
jgi:hypothetical protein